ncbi:hypothetical protein ES332_D11G392300v1 [Gossypium tomentosum]|uniref:Uncharacterized protein n=1 Tax=Gossypium tomentosum TaxID=34277 RepID=A0A5D2IZ12_GOSTO|nr:hypothetical protein ES332_D11G392300v1 [Gossypium tomentosum]
MAPVIGHRTGRRMSATAPPSAVAGKPKYSLLFLFSNRAQIWGQNYQKNPATRDKIGRDLSILPPHIRRNQVL